MAKNETQILILGGGLSGLTAAALLEKANVDYLLLESANEFGGLAKSQLEQDVWLDYGLKSIPVGEELSTNPLVTLKKQLDLDIQIESWTEKPLTRGQNGFEEFVGFGESKNRSLIDELQYYTQSPRLLVSGGWRHLTTALLDRIPEKKRLSKSHVTKLNLEAGEIKSVIINGEKLIEAKTILFTLSPILLRNLLLLTAQDEALNKTIARIHKTEPLTVFSLDIATRTNVGDSKNIFLLNDTSEDDFFVVGQFITNVDPLRKKGDLNISSWLTLSDSEALLDDGESGSKIIKTMKKVIKKAFPDLLSETVQAWERLIVVPAGLGFAQYLSLEKNGQFPGIKNLYLAGGQLKGPCRNLSSALETAIRFCSMKPAVDHRLQSPSPEINL